MHELCDSRTLRVDLLRFCRFHLGLECSRRSGLFDARYRPAPLEFRSGRRAVIAQRAGAADSLRRAIDMRAHAVPTVEYRAVLQLLSCGAHETILLGIVRESRAYECRLAPQRILLAGLPAVLPGAVEVHAAFCSALDRSVIRVVPIGDDLLRQLANLLLAALQRRIELAIINRVGRGFHVHDQTVLGVGDHLHVVTRHRAAFAVPHYVSFRVGR